MSDTEPSKTIADPACGTGGFFLSAYDYLVKQRTLTPAQKRFLKNETFHGNEIVAGTRRLCLMNLFLHGIGEIEGNSSIASTDRSSPRRHRLSTTSSPTRPSARRAR